MNSKFGFIYLWYDIKRKMYYVGSHWGLPGDGYICSSNWMRTSYNRRPEDFKRRIIARVYTNRKDLLDEEQRWLDMIKPEETNKLNTLQENRDSNVRYYNLSLKATGWKVVTEEEKKAIGDRISEAKTGKKHGLYSDEHKVAISRGKREAFERRRAETGSSYSPETVQSWIGMERGPQSEESNRRRSESLKLAYAEGRKKANTRPKTDEEKQHLSKTMKGRPGKPQSDETRIKLSKTYLVTTPTGEKMTVTNMKRFCAENGLQNTNITKKSGSKGWFAIHLLPVKESQI